MGDTTSRKILVADDDPGVRRAFTRFLERSGYRVETTEDGPATIDRLRQDSFDLVLLDVWMPGGTGFDVLAALRGENLPRVLIVTSDETPETVLQAADTSAFRFLRKPIEMDTLLAAVEEALSTEAEPLRIQITSAIPKWVEFLVPCDLVTANRTQNLIEQLEADLPDDVHETIAVAFRELFLNAVEWGGKLNPEAHVRIACIRTERSLQLRISDPGEGFSFDDLKHAAVGQPGSSTAHVEVRAKAGLRPGGFGILMARGFVDEIIYNERQNEVLMIKYLDDA